MNRLPVPKPDRKPPGPDRLRNDLWMIANIVVRVSWKARPAVSTRNTPMRFRSTQLVQHRQIERPSFLLSLFEPHNVAIMTKPSARHAKVNARHLILIRSEERRVGKECRSRW